MKVVLCVALLLGLLATTAAIARADHDGCGSAGQPCVCSNTGWEGFCGRGPLKRGLYCQCDRGRNHDGCAAPGQPCVCGNTGWRGVCDRGNLKPGLYCHCD